MCSGDVLQGNLSITRESNDVALAMRPLWTARERVNETLVRLDSLQMYADGTKGDRLSIASEKLLRMLLLGLPGSHRDSAASDDIATTDGYDVSRHNYKLIEKAD